MSEVEQYLRVLHDWKEQPGRTITSVLARIEQTKTFKGRELDDIYKGVVDFHRQIGKADEGLVDLKWYELCISTKKKLKKMQQTAEKLKKNQPVLEKKSSSTFIIDYPEELKTGRGQVDDILKYMYRSFVTNFEEGMNEPKAAPFIVATFKELRQRMDDRLDGAMNKRITSICNRLAKESSKESKIRMLKGQITPKELSDDDQQLYFDQKTKDNIKRIQMEELERSRTGFYDDMKKLINKDACEECRYCHKKTAYCEDQKQIRASDEPMTRFMRCNACEKAWRD